MKAILAEPATVASNNSEPILPAWSAEEFLARELPPKEALIEGLLYRRDLVALAGRRRHGKTNFILNLATALTTSQTDFIGYFVERELRVLVFFLEDDTSEIQDKLRRVLNGASTEGRLSLQTREDFYKKQISIDLNDHKFCEVIHSACKSNEPDLIILDNLAQMIGADYNNSKRIHALATFAFELTSAFNAAVLVAAHPRKRPSDGTAIYTSNGLRDNSEGFFEDVMGSSHFVNSFGSLWGIERDSDTDRTVFLGGAQRVTGQQSIATLEIGDDNKLRIVSDYEESLSHALNTSQRKAAWRLMPDYPFKYMEAVAAVKPVMRSQSSFHAWWSTYLIRLKLVVPEGDRYIKVTGVGKGGN
jgi:AAA domain